MDFYNHQKQNVSHSNYVLPFVIADNVQLE
jgi:hypothetical protein